MEERIVARAQKKLFLDAMVNRGGTGSAKSMDQLGFTHHAIPVAIFLNVHYFGFRGERALKASIIWI